MKFLLAFLLVAFGSKSLLAAENPIKDQIPPKISISLPRRGAILHYFTPLYGWVKDNEGGSGIARISVSLQRRSEGKTFFWDGGAWSRAPWKIAPNSQCFAQLIGNRWKFEYLPDRRPQFHESDIPYDGPQLVSGIYIFHLTASDRAGNQSSVWRTVRVKADTSRPSITISRPRHSQFFSSFGAVQGMVRDRGGSGLCPVIGCSIIRLKDAYSWDGSWKAPGIVGATWFFISPLRGRWKLGRNVPTGKALSRGLYRIELWTGDRAGNRSDMEFYGLPQDTFKGPGKFHLYSTSLIIRIR